MSNALSLAPTGAGPALAPAAARRQFWISLGVGLAVLVFAANSHGAPSPANLAAPAVRHAPARPPHVFTAPTRLADLRESATAGPPSRVD